MNSQSILIIQLPPEGNESQGMNLNIHFLILPRFNTKQCLAN